MLEEIFIGVAGGAIAELVQWFGLRYTLHKQLPDWSKSGLYWVVTSLMILAGGGLVYLYTISGTTLTPLLSFNIGASAPLLLGKLIQQAPPPDIGKVF